MHYFWTSVEINNIFILYQIIQNKAKKILLSIANCLTIVIKYTCHKMAFQSYNIVCFTKENRIKNEKTQKRFERDENLTKESIEVFLEA